MRVNLEPSPLLPRCWCRNDRQQNRPIVNMRLDCGKEGQSAASAYRVEGGRDCADQIARQGATRGDDIAVNCHQEAAGEKPRFLTR